MAIDNAFRESGITIAFPQRDIHVRTIQDELPIVERGNEESD
jgi:small-conductance mechanosensitive channel